jgi:hypothetical protein
MGQIKHKSGKRASGMPDEIRFVDDSARARAKHFWCSLAFTGAIAGAEGEMLLRLSLRHTFRQARLR